MLLVDLSKQLGEAKYCSYSTTCGGDIRLKAIELVVEPARVAIVES